MCKSYVNRIVIALLLCSSMPMVAQKHLLQPEVYIGVHGGVLASTVLFSPSVPNMSPITDGTLLGGNGGLVFRYSGQKCCALQVELNYMQRGWREHGEGVDYKRQLHYVELPFLMHIYFGSPMWRGFVNLGPQIGYCVKDDMGTGIKSETSKHQYAPLDHRFDWGVAGGLGVYCRTKRAGVYQLEARFSYAFGTIFDHNASDYFSGSNPMTLSLNVAWLWEIKRTAKTKNER